jgi:hypothetical protein
MWKNVFLESCILSALIFGGFYLNAAFLKDELYNNPPKSLSHISGSVAPLESLDHISGLKSKKKTLSHISGIPSLTAP